MAYSPGAICTILCNRSTLPQDTATTRKLWAFRQAFEDHVTVPCDGFVIGEPVSLIEFDYDGNERRGLTARCRREDGSEHVVAVSDVVVPQRLRGARYNHRLSQVAGLRTVPSLARYFYSSQTRHKGGQTTSTRSLIDEVRKRRGWDKSQEKE